MSSTTTLSSPIEASDKEPLLIATALGNDYKVDISKALKVDNYGNPIKELYRMFSGKKEKIINQRIQSNSYLYSLIEPIYENYTSGAKKRSVRDKEIDKRLTQYFQTHPNINRIMQNKNAYIETGGTIIKSLRHKQKENNDYDNYIINSRNRNTDLVIILSEIYSICQNEK